MNDDAQGALLKTLEEPPIGATIVLCADEEARLAPTIRSRCARIRLGPVGPRDVEAVLTERGVADPPLAARLARLVGGRSGDRPDLRAGAGRAPDPRRAGPGAPRPHRRGPGGSAGRDASRHAGRDGPCRGPRRRRDGRLVAAGSVP